MVQHSGSARGGVTLLVHLLSSFLCHLHFVLACKLFRALRLTMLNYVRELWFTLMDRRHAASNVYARALLRIDWSRVQRMLGKTANRRGRVMPDWTTMTRKPTCTIKSALAKWENVRRVKMRLLEVNRRSRVTSQSYAGRLRNAPEAPR